MIKMTPKIDEKARKALARALALHLTDPNVALIDLGFRIDPRENRIEPELAVRIHVYEKYPRAAFESFSDFYPNRVIRSEKIGFPVVVIQALYQIQSIGQPCRVRPHPARFYPVLCGGMAISNGSPHSYATLGGLVRDRRTGADLLLSSWHGLSGPEEAENRIVYQPGKPWVAGELFAIGEYFRDALDLHMDVAVARSYQVRPIKNEQIGIDAITGPGQPVPGMQVIKSGARTGVTRGLVTGVLGSSMRFCRGRRRLFTNLVHIATQEPDSLLCANGDSGAWWLEAESLRAVAVHFAGHQNPDYALAFAMPEVLAALNVELAVKSQTSVWFPHLRDPRPASLPFNPVDRHRTRIPVEENADPTESGIPAIFKDRPGRFIARLPDACEPRPGMSERPTFNQWSWYYAAWLLFLVIFLQLGIRLSAKIWFSEQLPRLTAIEQGLNTLHHLAIVDFEYRSATQKICTIIEKYNPEISDSLRARIAREIYFMSKKYSRLDVELLCATITHETGRTWDPEVVSPAGAIGLMQIMPLTGSYLARQAGLTDRDIKTLLYDPICNIRLGCRYLAFLIDAYGIDGGLAAYNGGMARAEEWLRSGKVDGILYTETALYVPAILRIYQKLKYQKNS